MRDRCFIESTGVRIVVLTIAILVPHQFLLAQSDPSIDQLIQDLGSPQARLRDEAAAKLLAIGEPARQALRQATDDPVPEVSSRAWGLLGRLPFHVAKDPPEVKACLFDYERDEEESRGGRIERLGMVGGTAAWRALLRIARDEPSQRLRWKAVGLFVSCDDPVALADVRRIRASLDDPIQLVLSACGWRATELARARKLLGRAVRADPNPGSSASEMAMHLLPLLKSLEMHDEARQVFDAGYRPLLDNLADAPADATRMNQLASYCLRCDQYLPQALDLSTRALAAEPYNPHFLDTLAQVQFRLGRPDEAVRLEEKALRLRPFDHGIEKRLEQYLAAVE